MKKIQMTAPAKLNICLEVVKRYDDGFHEIRSIMLKSQKLYDDVVVEFLEGEEGIVIECDNSEVPTDEQNICWKIVEGFFAKTGKQIGVKINIVKRIPMLAGLGGGSSDGASVLLALNEYFGDNSNGKNSNPGPILDRNLGLLEMDELVKIASEVGKDIPFFLQDAFVAYVGGAGENVESVFDFPNVPILVVNPKVEISTPWAYGELDRRQWFMNMKNRKNISLQMKNNHHTLEDIVQSIYNDFDFVAKEQCKEIGEIQNAMKAFGAMSVSISGKGPTIFGIFESVEDLEKTEKIFQKQYKKYFISQF